MPCAIVIIWLTLSKLEPRNGTHKRFGIQIPCWILIEELRGKIVYQARLSLTLQKSEGERWSSLIDYEGVYKYCNHLKVSDTKFQQLKAQTFEIKPWCESC